MRERFTRLQGGDEGRRQAALVDAAPGPGRAQGPRHRGRGTGKEPIAGRGESCDPPEDDQAAQELAEVAEKGGRPELADQERAEIAILASFLPQQMDEAATAAAIAAAIAETGAAGSGDMGKVMAALKAAHAGQMDFGKAERAGQGRCSIARPTPQLPPLCNSGPSPHTSSIAAPRRTGQWRRMARCAFRPAFLDEIRDRVPISSVVGRRVTWDRRKTKRRAATMWACCPFHGEKSPSFHCEDKKGRYHCFGCGVSGDHFRFLTELDGHELSRGGRAHRRHGRRADAGARPERREAREASAPACTTSWSWRRSSSRSGCRRADGAQGARLSARPRPDAGHAADVPARLCARQPQCAEGASSPARACAQGADRGLRARRHRRGHPGLL